MREFENFATSRYGEQTYSQVNLRSTGYSAGYDMFINKEIKSEDSAYQHQNDEMRNMISNVPSGFLKLISYLYLLIYERNIMLSQIQGRKGNQKSFSQQKDNQQSLYSSKVIYHYELVKVFLEKERNAHQALQIEAKELRNQVDKYQILQTSDTKQKLSSSSQNISPNRPPLQHNVKFSKPLAPKQKPSPEQDESLSESILQFKGSETLDQIFSQTQQSTTQNIQDTLDMLDRSERVKFANESPIMNKTSNQSPFGPQNRKCFYQHKSSKSLTPHGNSESVVNQSFNKNESIIERLRDQSREKYLNQGQSQNSQKKLDFSELRSKLTPYLKSKNDKQQDSGPIQLNDLDLLSRESISIKNDFPSEVKQLEAEDEYFSTSPSSNRSSIKKQSHVQTVPYFNTQSTLQLKNSITSQTKKVTNPKDQAQKRMGLQSQSPFARKNSIENFLPKRPNSSLSKIKEPIIKSARSVEGGSPMIRSRKRQNSIKIIKHSESERLKTPQSQRQSSSFIISKSNPYKQTVNKKPPSIKKQSIIN